jgi:hypothetical protein
MVTGVSELVDMVINGTNAMNFPDSPSRILYHATGTIIMLLERF